MLRNLPRLRVRKSRHDVDLLLQKRRHTRAGHDDSKRGWCGSDCGGQVVGLLVLVLVLSNGVGARDSCL